MGIVSWLLGRPQASQSDNQSSRSERATTATPSKTPNPAAQEAVQRLCGSSLESAVPRTEADIRTMHSSLQHSWNSKVLLGGTKEQILPIVLQNCERLANQSGFQGFEINLLPIDGAAQISASYGFSFRAIRAWRAVDSIYVCGDSEFSFPQESAELRVFRSVTIKKAGRSLPADGSKISTQCKYCSTQLNGIMGGLQFRRRVGYHCAGCKTSTCLDCQKAQIIALAKRLAALDTAEFVDKNFEICTACDSSYYADAIGQA